VRFSPRWSASSRAGESAAVRHQRPARVSMPVGLLARIGTSTRPSALERKTATDLPSVRPQRAGDGRCRSGSPAIDVALAGDPGADQRQPRRRRRGPKRVPAGERRSHPPAVGAVARSRQRPTGSRRRLRGFRVADGFGGGRRPGRPRCWACPAAHAADRACCRHWAPGTSAAGEGQDAATAREPTPRARPAGDRGHRLPPRWANAPARGYRLPGPASGQLIRRRGTPSPEGPRRMIQTRQLHPLHPRRLGHRHRDRGRGRAAPGAAAHRRGPRGRGPGQDQPRRRVRRDPDVRGVRGPAGRGAGLHRGAGRGAGAGQTRPARSRCGWTRSGSTCTGRTGRRWWRRRPTRRAATGRTPP
jgi:hypothetical protein